MSYETLASHALAGTRLSRDESRQVLSSPDEDLLHVLAAAYRVRRHHWGNRVRLHFLLNAQSGLCPEDCHYCTQSSVSTSEIEKYPMLARDKILAAAGRAAALRAGTFCLVISGRSPGERVFGKVLDAVRDIRSQYDLKVCACLGLLSTEQTLRLKDAGVETVNHNLNTSANFHGEVCTTHTFDDRVATVEHVKAAGIKTCSGGIIGMGESDDDVIDLAMSLRELDVRSVPVNFLLPLEGTPFEERRLLDPRRCLRVLALYRFLLPSQEIRIAGGREAHLRSLQPLGLYPANSIFIGDYLTSRGQPASADYAMIRDAGFVLETPDGEPFEVPEHVEVEYPRAPLAIPAV
ncbi:MAG TPA: biotin synthase BioB [Gemmatimonadaceae bacterium]|jgi:biotin synthase|nr:biotin synthase BioB [Gemmatimonadaceae bacterium]